jgi:HK97 family phage prohead protease
MSKKNFLPEKENRYMELAPTVEIREAEDGTKKITGYAIVFNQKSQVLYGWFREVISQDALNNTDLDDVKATLGHNFTKLLGRTTSGTLVLTQDDKGLKYEITPPDTESGREALELVSRGDITGSSFIFDLNEGGQKWSKDEDGVEMRTITDIRRVYELGPVIDPAYVQTSAEVAKRSFEMSQTSEEADEGKDEGNDDTVSAQHALLDMEIDLMMV